MYESAAFDLHLSGVMAKRLRGVTQIPIEFQRNGKPDDVINKQLRSPWFKELRKELILSEFWGFTLLQLYIGEDQNIHFESINRKHYDPIKRKLLRFQGDMDGLPIENFQNMLFIGSERGLGIFAEILLQYFTKKETWETGRGSAISLVCQFVNTPTTQAMKKQEEGLSKTPDVKAQTLYIFIPKIAI